MNENINEEFGDDILLIINKGKAKEYLEYLIIMTPSDDLDKKLIELCGFLIKDNEVLQTNQDPDNKQWLIECESLEIEKLNVDLLLIQENNKKLELENEKIKLNLEKRNSGVSTLDLYCGGCFSKLKYEGP